MRRELPAPAIAAAIAVTVALLAAGGWYCLSRQPRADGPPAYTPQVPAWAQNRPGPPLPATIGSKTRGAP